MDANGNFVLQPLPYAENFEPYMDSETLHLHYTFHHGGATKAANKDQQMILKALNENNMETVDYWTKNFHFICRLIFYILFWTNLGNKATMPKGELLKRIEKDFGSYDKLKGYLAATSKMWMETVGAFWVISLTPTN